MDYESGSICWNQYVIHRCLNISNVNKDWTHKDKDKDKDKD